MEFISLCDNFTLTWQFNGKDITNDANYVINISMTKQYHYNTSLKVAQSSGNDAGMYTVTISIPAGSVSENITVIIMGMLLVVCIILQLKVHVPP